MNPLSQQEADEYASWFRCLSDGTRVVILSIVASARLEMTVGEIVAATGKSQSTVSQHLQTLARERYVFTRQDGVRTLVRVNTACMTALPRAAAAIMGAAAQVPG